VSRVQPVMTRAADSWTESRWAMAVAHAPGIHAPPAYSSTGRMYAVYTVQVTEVLPRQAPRRTCERGQDAAAVLRPPADLLGVFGEGQDAVQLHCRILLNVDAVRPLHIEFCTVAAISCKDRMAALRGGLHEDVLQLSESCRQALGVSTRL